jgi:hypothetical protein
MADLVTSNFATTQLAGGTSPITLSTAQTTALPNLITAASQVIERYCARFFLAANYDEIRIPHPGQWDRNEPDIVSLRYPPIQTVSRVSGGRTTALTISNTDTSTNQRATVEPVLTGDPDVQLTVTGIVLKRVHSGTLDTQTLTFGNYATVQDLASAVTALSSGWMAVVASNAAKFATVSPYYGFAELVMPTGPQGALAGQSSGARLDVFSTDWQTWDVDNSTGVLYLGQSDGITQGGPGSPYLWPNSFDAGQASGSFRPPVRVTYNAGFTTVPLAVQQACVEVVKAMFDRLPKDVTLTAESIGDHSVSEVAASALEAIPMAARQTLAMYRRVTA